MSSKRYIRQWMGLLVALLCLAACSEDRLTPYGEGEVTVTFQPKLDTGIDTRAIGDGTKVNQLVVRVYETESETMRYEATEDYPLSENSLSFTLLAGREYKILFWAQVKDAPYTVKNDLSIKVDYSKYLNAGFEGMEQLDAFYYAETFTAGAGSSSQEVTLYRPFAQLNFADDKTQPISQQHKAIVTLSGIATTFHPFEGTTEVAKSDLPFTFTDFPEETLSANNTTYYYVASNYLFVPSTNSVKATIELQNADGSSINSHTFDAIPLAPNKRTNVLGTIIQEPEVPTGGTWDGVTLTEPTSSCAVQIEDTEGTVLHIGTPAELAWCMKNGYKEATTIHICADLDLKYKDENGTEQIYNVTSVQSPKAGVKIIGSDHTISNIKASSTGLFGDVQKLTVKNLTFSKIEISNSSAAAGVLAGTVTGSSSFTNVKVEGCTVTTSGADSKAGGIVGYVSRIEPNDRGEELAVTFSNCQVNSTSISGVVSGKFVGELSGYDNGEVLTFETCSASEVTGVSSSVFNNSYKSCFIETTLSDSESDLLGRETYCRGVVKYGDNRFIPKWDGERTVTPLTDGSTKLIYSAYDLASVQNLNPGTIKFMENVDMGSKVFVPLISITKLAGENKTIYNLKVETTFNTNSWDGGGLIRKCSVATIENITFKDADVRVTHVEDSDGDAYASIVCGTAEGTNTFNNVKVEGGYLYGCNKMGGIAGYITGTFTAKDCTVDGLTIENYDSGGKDALGFKANGEVGGMFGFLAANATISGCSVVNTKLDCIGVDNGKIVKYFKYSGRHVNEFIGDIRTTGGQTITITYSDNAFSNNTYSDVNSNSIGGREDHYGECYYIGNCYYTDISIGSIGIKDTKGTVTVNSKSITVVNGYK